MKNNDILWKAILEDIFPDFLLFFYPQSATLFDLDKGVEYLDKELEQLFPPDNDQFEPKYVDKLVKVFTTNGSEEWVLVHIEVQGYTDEHFAWRMYQYYCRILDKYNKQIAAFAILTDNNKTFKPSFYKRDFLGTRVIYEFNTYKILEQDDILLQKSDNPFAMVVLAAKLSLAAKSVKDPQLFDMAYSLAKQLLSKQLPKDKIRKVMNFLRYSLSFEKQETFSKFEQEIAKLTERNITMGIEEFLLDRAKKEGLEKGIEKGKKEGKKEEAIAIALEMKKDGIPFNQISKFTKLSVEEIENL